MIRGKLAFVLALLFLIVAGCASEPTPEEQIRALVEGAARAFESGDVDALVRLASADFEDARGRGREALEGTLRLYFRQAGERHVLTRVESIALEQASSARLVLSAAIARAEITSLEGLTRADAHLLRFELDLVDEGEGAWRVTRAEWRELAGF